MDMRGVCGRRRLIATIGAVGLTGCVGGADEEREADRPDPDVLVRITDEYTFDPDVVEVDVGETVTWRNTWSRIQTVTAYEDEIPTQTEYFASGGSGREVTARILYPLVGGLSQGEKYSNTFEVPGTYRYFSIPSEGRGMSGTVIVTE